MAGTRIDNAVYGTDADWEDETISKDILKTGYEKIVFDSGVIKAGTYVAVNDDIYIFRGDYTVSGSVPELSYLKAIISGDELIVEYTEEVLPAYDFQKKGFYNGAGERFIARISSGVVKILAYTAETGNGFWRQWITDNQAEFLTKIADTRIIKNTNLVNDYFGIANTIDRTGTGEYLASAGMYNGTTVSGKVYIYKRDLETTPIEWNLTETIVGEPTDRFGESISMSGDFIAVGSNRWGSDEGKVYIYEKQLDESWTLSAEITSPNPGTERLGYTVSLWEDDLLVFCGSLITYVYVFHRDENGDWDSGTQISPTGAGTGVGQHCTMVKDRFVLGDSVGDKTFVYRKTGTTWGDEAIITPESGFGSGWGFVVDMIDDLVIVSDESNLKVFIYERSGDNTWTLQNTITGADNYFGQHVSISSLRWLMVDLPGAGTFKDSFLYKYIDDVWEEIVIPGLEFHSIGPYSSCINDKTLVIGDNGVYASNRRGQINIFTLPYMGDGDDIK